MKRILIALMLLSMPASSNMRALEIPVNSVCWDSVKEALEYHATIRELPIVNMKSGDLSGAILLVNPDNTKWTFLAYKTNPVTNQTAACAFFKGDNWDVIIPPKPEEKIEL
jgi:hypothetical protein